MSTRRVVLVTGATSGIGLGLAQRYARTGARVAITGRSAARLEQARRQLPGATTVVGDLAVPAERERLADVVRAELGELDVLVNNAGIQRRVEIARDGAPWAERQEELDVLLAAPIHLSSLLLPLLHEHGRPSQIINVTSGGAFNPQPFAPTYSAAKAALHSHTLNLRYALRDTAVKVTELIPPAVATGLGGTGLGHGADLDEFCDAVFPLLEQGGSEVGFGPTATITFRQRLADERQRFEDAATRVPVARYPAERS